MIAEMPLLIVIILRGARSYRLKTSFFNYYGIFAIF